jgi:predicted HAD superfamily hydrolase
MISFDVFDTDMYMDSSTIEEILQNCGYDLADVPIYVSSEYGKTKRSGNLFRTVLEHEEVEASKILHIGDNLISDYLMPKKCGMKSFYTGGRNCSKHITC